MRFKLAEAWFERKNQNTTGYELAQNLYQQVFRQKADLALTALERLIYLGNQAILDEIEATFAIEPDPATRAVMAKGFAVRHQCDRLFDELEQDQNATIRRGLVSALYLCSFLEQEKPAFQHFEALARDPDPQIRRTAAFKLIELANHDKSLRERLLPGLASPLPEMQMLGIWSAGLLEKLDRLDSVISLLGSESALVRWESLDFISEQIKPEHLPALQALLPHPDLLFDVSLRLLSASLQSGQDLMIEVQRQWAKYGDRIEREIHEMLKSALKTQRLSPAELSPLLNSPEPQLVQVALNLVSPYKASAELQSVLLPLLRDPEIEIREGAINVIGPGPENDAVVQSLINNLRHPKAYIRAATLKKLASLDIKTFQDQAPALVQDPSSQVRGELLRTWKQYAYRSILQPQTYLLWPLLKDSEFEIADEAADLLASTGHKADWDQLHSQLKSGKSFLLKLSIFSLFNAYLEEKKQLEWYPLLYELLQSSERTPLNETREKIDEYLLYRVPMSWQPSTEEEVLKWLAAEALLNSSSKPVPELLGLLEHPQLAPVLIAALDSLETSPEWARLLENYLPRVSKPEIRKSLQALIEKLK